MGADHSDLQHFAQPRSTQRAESVQGFSWYTACFALNKIEKK
jgi:hypothetical protein